MTPAPGQTAIVIRPYTDANREFLTEIAPRMQPGPTASPRDPEALTRFFEELATAGFSDQPGIEVFLATHDDVPAGVIANYPDTDHFTGRARAHVEILVVAAAAEGQGDGRALLGHAETWARAHHCREVVLDVFAGNHHAMAFHERMGFAPDHIRMAKSLL